MHFYESPTERTVNIRRVNNSSLVTPRGQEERFNDSSLNFLPPQLSACIHKHMDVSSFPYHALSVL